MKAFTDDKITDSSIEICTCMWKRKKKHYLKRTKWLLQRLSSFPTMFSKAYIVRVFTEKLGLFRT